MSNIDTLIANAVKNAEITDFIMIVRGKCYTLISVEDFIKDITFGGQAVCDTLLNCWKSMGQFDGGNNPANGDDEECDCSDDFVKIHFPKGEGIKIISSEEYTKVADSIYVQTIGLDKYKLVVVDEEGNVREMEMPDSPTIDYPVIDGEALAYTTDDPGINVFKKLEDKKLQFLPLIGENIAITYLYSGDEVVAIKIGNPDNFAFRTFYINENYPENDSDGSLSKPYKTFQDCFNAYVSPLEDNPNRPGEKYNRAYPKNQGARISLLSNITTNLNLSINELILDTSFNNYTITYTGTDPYMIDTEVIYPLIDKTGSFLNNNLIIKIIGNGSFNRTDDVNRGLVRCWGSDRTNSGSFQGGISTIFIGDPTSYLTFREANPIVDGSFIDMNILVNGIQQPLASIYGSPFKASSASRYLPVTSKSLFNVKYRNPGTTATFVQQGKCRIGSFSQTSFYAEDALLNLEDDLLFFGLNDLVAYNGNTTNQTPDPSGRTWVHYIPHNGKYLMQLEGTTTLYCKGFRMDERAGFGNYGWDAGIYTGINTVIQEINYKFFSIHYYNSFFKLATNKNIFYLGTGGGGTISELSIPNAEYLVSGGVSNVSQNITAVGINTTVFSFKNLKPLANISPLVFETSGTLLGLKGKPVISGIESFANATVAESSGIVAGGLFKDASKDNNINSI